MLAYMPPAGKERTLNLRSRKIHLRKTTVWQLSTELAGQARGGTIDLGTKSQGLTNCTCQFSCGGTCDLTCDETCHETCDATLEC